LADHFKEVQATDISKKQIDNAIRKPNLHYHVCNAEQLPFSDNYFDLITTATAVHWFRFDEFFSEIKRVAKNNGIFACWAYSVFRTDQTFINSMVDQFYGETVHAYWDAERRHVDEEYRNIPMPFNEIKNPGFSTRLTWDLESLEGYLNTWSAVQNYIRKNRANPVNELMVKIRSNIGDNAKISMTFPIFMRIGVITK
jgi:SAM-dependent methyltransferase